MTFLYSCNIELRLDKIPAFRKQYNTFAILGLIFGLAAMTIGYAVGPYAIFFSGFGLTSFKPQSQKNRWMDSDGTRCAAGRQEVDGRQGNLRKTRSNRETQRKSVIVEQVDSPPSL